MNTQYHSCHYIQSGLNFYPNNKIKICCFTGDDAVDTALTTDSIEVIVEKIFAKKQEMITQFRLGNIYDCCKKCPCLSNQTWKEPTRQIRSVTLNHFMFCNLKCGHYGYLEGAQSGRLKDTDHDRVLEIITELDKSGVLSDNVSFDVGGGEPSVSEGLQKIVSYILANRKKVHINSNGARYVELFATGVNEGLLSLTLTPDAGSRETYIAVKGQDNFLKTWKNIGQYVSTCNGQVLVKFILQEANVSDIHNMIGKSAEAGVKHVSLSLDLRITNPDQQQAYIPHIRTFRELASQQRMDVRPGLMPSNLWQQSTPDQPAPPILKLNRQQINATLNDPDVRQMMEKIWELLGAHFKQLQATLPAEYAMQRRELSFHEHVLLLGYLCHLIENLPGDIVEIGVWKGKSLALMNEVCNHQRRIIGIDPLGLQNQLSEFSHYKNALFPNAHIIRGFSELSGESFYSLSPRVALLHIDGGHKGKNVLLDFLLYSPSVVPGGFIVFDDYSDHQYSPEVGPAVDLLRAGGYFNGFNIIGCIHRFENSYIIQKQ